MSRASGTCGPEQAVERLRNAHANLARENEALKRRLRKEAGMGAWTRELPTAVGKYWVRWPTGGVSLEEVEDYAGELVVTRGADVGMVAYSLDPAAEDDYGREPFEFGGCWWAKAEPPPFDGEG